MSASAFCARSSRVAFERLLAARARRLALRGARGGRPDHRRLAAPSSPATAPAASAGEARASGAL